MTRKAVKIVFPLDVDEDGLEERELLSYSELAI